MKKLIMFVMSFLILFSLCTSGLARENDNKENETVLEDVVEAEKSDVEEQGDGVPNSKIARSTNIKKITIKRFLGRIKDGSGGNELVSLPHSEYKISYIHDGKEVYIGEKGVTNENGEIVNIPEIAIPSEVTSIRFRYYLGNEKRGYIQKYNNLTYQFVVSQNISQNSVIVINGYSNFWVGQASDPDRYFYNFQAARLNYFYDQAVEEFSSLIKSTNDLLPKTAKFDVAPINMNFKQGEYVDDNNYFCRNGYDQKGTANIVIADRTDRMYSEQAVKSKVMHEWTHWNSYRETQAGLPWTGNDKTGYREGWAYLVGHMFAYNYDLSSKDLLVQTDNKDGVNRYFGKACSMTSEHVLYDLLDVVSQDEDFSLSRRFLDGPFTEIEERKMNLGILHTIMIESKATTLQEFLNYLENKYILTTSDKRKYEKALEVNGLSKDGSYNLDGK